ncbi:MAG: hypothetical protein CMF75_10705 [Maricaulis sp.]|nr:hypothetical protein [Maricaulis sp.]
MSAAAFALDGEKQETRVRVQADHNVMIGGDGPIIELRGANGERTLHMERDGEDTVITVNGQTIEIEDGEVRIDGQVVEASDHSVVIVDGDTVRVVGGDFDMELDQEFEIHMAERAEHLARMGEEIRARFESEDGVHAYAFAFDDEGGEDLHETIMESLEAAMAGLENGRHHGDDWEDLSAEEREEVREALREAREEMREAMREVRAEMTEMEGERRRVRVELREAARDMARAEREMARAAREERRIEIIRRHGEAEDSEGVQHRWEWRSDHDAAIFREQQAQRESRNVRVEQDEDGRRRVWVNGEEQTGDDLTEWLNQLESDRLAGAAGRGDDGHHMRRVERLEFRSGDGERQVIELEGGQTVVVEIQTDDED